MTCSYCQLAGCCSGIGACAANQKYLKAYLQRHPGKIVSGNLARQICNLGKREEDAGKLKEIKESLYSLAEQKQTDLFRMARRLLATMEILPLRGRSRRRHGSLPDIQRSFWTRMN